MKSSWRDDVLCWRLTVPRSGAHHVRGLLNHVHVQDQCSCLSARRQFKPTVFSLSTWVFSLLSCSVAIFAAADVYPCIVFMSHIAHLIFVCSLLEHKSLTTMGCQDHWFERCKGKQELYQFHSFDLNYSISWDIQYHLKGFLTPGPVFGWKVWTCSERWK